MDENSYLYLTKGSTFKTLYNKLKYGNVVSLLAFITGG
jgi:hypothetical protein